MSEIVQFLMALLFNETGVFWSLFVISMRVSFWLSPCSNLLFTLSALTCCSQSELFRRNIIFVEKRKCAFFGFLYVQENIFPTLLPFKGDRHKDNEQIHVTREKENAEHVMALKMSEKKKVYVSTTELFV